MTSSAGRTEKYLITSARVLNSYSATAEYWRLTYRSLKKLIDPVAPSACFAVARPAGRKAATIYADLTEPLPPQKPVGPAVQLGTFVLDFAPYVNLGGIWALLAEDLCLASYLLLVLHNVTNQRVRLVVQVPEGYAD